MHAQHKFNNMHEQYKSLKLSNATLKNEKREVEVVRDKEIPA